jgi:hypothetical protein
MPLLLVTYDSNKPIKNHPDIRDHIEKYSNIRLSDSSYVIITDKTPKEVCGELYDFIEKNDNLFVITLKLPYDGCGPGIAQDWLKKGLTY